MVQYILKGASEGFSNCFYDYTETWGLSHIYFQEGTGAVFSEAEERARKGPDIRTHGPRVGQGTDRSLRTQREKKGKPPPTPDHRGSRSH